jgi:hypothetical protein
MDGRAVGCEGGGGGSEGTDVLAHSGADRVVVGMDFGNCLAPLDAEPPIALCRLSL